MKKGDRLPDSDHVARHIPKKRIAESGLPTGSAFREIGGSISAGWLERFPDNGDPLARVIECMRRKRHIGGESKLAVLRVGQIRAAVETAEVVYDPLPCDCTHSGITGCGSVSQSDALAKLVKPEDMHSP